VQPGQRVIGRQGADRDGRVAAHDHLPALRLQQRAEHIDDRGEHGLAQSAGRPCQPERTQVRQGPSKRRNFDPERFYLCDHRAGIAEWIAEGNGR